jgi:hypothetical protein
MRNTLYERVRAGGGGRTEAGPGGVPAGTADVLVDRIGKRGIKYEQHIERSYLEKLTSLRALFPQLRCVARSSSLGSHRPGE